MENCTIYSHHLKFDRIAEIVKSNLPDARVEINDGGLRKSIVAKIKGGFFGKSKSLTINYRQRQNPSYQLQRVECGLTQNLAGMLNYVQSIPAKNEVVRTQFLHQISAANCEMAFLAKPQIAGEFEPVLKNIVTEIRGFIYTQPGPFFNHTDGQYFLNSNFELILDTEGNSRVENIDVKIDAQYYDQPKENETPEQAERKARSESILKQRGVKINANLQSLRASSDIQLRSPEEIIDRAYALLITAVKGEGIEQEHLVKAIKSKNIRSFSPREEIIFQAGSLSDEDRAYATWRYEGLNTILWALGLLDELPYPSAICDVPKIVELIFQPSRSDFEGSVKMREPEEIMDVLDLHYRMNWACVDARIKGEEVSGSLDSGVVYERHYALNWLTCDGNKEWDDVQTNT